MDSNPIVIERFFPVERAGLDLRVRCQRWVEDAPAGPPAALNLTADRLTLRTRPPVFCLSDSCFALFTGYGWPSSSGAAVLGLFCLNGQSVRLRHKTPPPLAAARRLLTLASAKKAKHESEPRPTVFPGPCRWRPAPLPQRGAPPSRPNVAATAVHAAGPH